MNPTNAHQADRDANKATRKKNTDKGYDNAVHAGAPGEEHDDIYERLARADVDVDGDIADNVEPENLLAAIEGTSECTSADDIAEAIAIESPELGQEDIALALTMPSRDDDDGPVSPEELGEQFLRVPCNRNAVPTPTIESPTTTLTC